MPLIKFILQKDKYVRLSIEQLEAKMTNVQRSENGNEAGGHGHAGRAGGVLGYFEALNKDSMRDQDRSNERRVNTYACLWSLTLISTAVIKGLGQFQQPIIALIFMLSVIPAALMVKSYLKMLREADEMFRTKQLEALAVGFGAGFISGTTVVFLEIPGPLGAIAIVAPMALGFFARMMLAGREAARDAAEAIDAKEEMK